MILRFAMRVGIFTLISRILGFTREMLMANVFGVSWITDVFLVGFRLPNTVRSLLSEGALASAFIPRYVHYSGDKNIYFSKIFCALVIFVMMISAGAWIFMPSIIRYVSPGFTNDYAKFVHAVSIARIMFWYICFISIANLGACVLRSHDKFSIPGMLPIILNIVLIIGIYFAYSPLEQYIYTLSYMVIIAGMLQILMILWSLGSAGISVSFVRISWDHDMRDIVLGIGMAFMCTGIYQLNMFVDMIFASNLPGNIISCLHYADRINQLPLALIGTSLSVALLPRLSKGDVKAHKVAMETALLLGIPAAIGASMMSHRIISVLFYHGNFSLRAVHISGDMLSILGMSLPASIISKVFAQNFFSRKKITPIFTIAFVSLVINILMNFLLKNHFQYRGIAISTVVSSWVNCLSLIVYCRKSGWIDVAPDLKRKMLWIAISGGVMSVVISVLSMILDSIHMNDISSLFLIMISASCSYLVVCAYGGLLSSFRNRKS